ncbi:MAG: PQQ-binding-like beta-propeller repeat protein [Planctomycetota bacterium]
MEWNMEEIAMVAPRWALGLCALALLGASGCTSNPTRTNSASLDWGRQAPEMFGKQQVWSLPIEVGQESEVDGIYLRGPYLVVLSSGGQDQATAVERFVGDPAWILYLDEKPIFPPIARTGVPSGRGAASSMTLAEPITFVMRRGLAVADLKYGSLRYKASFDTIAPATAPASNGRTLYIPSLTENNIYAFDLRGGNFGWDFRVRGGATSAPVCPPAASDMVVIASNDGRVYGLSARDAFALAPRDPVWVDRTGDAITAELGYGGPNAYVASNDSFVYAYNAGTGSRVWSYAGVKPFRRGSRPLESSRIREDSEINGRPIFAGGTVYAANELGLHAIDATTGQGKWVLAEGRRYLCSTDDGNVLILMRDGSIGEVDGAGDVVGSEPAMPGVMVLTNPHDNHLYLSDGNRIWALRERLPEER